MGDFFERSIVGLTIKPGQVFGSLFVYGNTRRVDTVTRILGLDNFPAGLKHARVSTRNLSFYKHLRFGPKAPGGVKSALLCQRGRF